MQAVADAQLMREMASGSETAARQVEQMVRLALAAFNSFGDDVVQETLIRLWRFADRYDGRASIKTWAYSIAARLAIDEHRRAASRKRVELAHEQMRPYASTYGEDFGGAEGVENLLSGVRRVAGSEAPRVDHVLFEERRNLSARRSGEARLLRKLKRAVARRGIE